MVAKGPGDGDIIGLAVDEAHDRLYAALPNLGKVLVYKASDLTPVEAEGWALPRATKLTVDGQGNVWMSQAADEAHLEKLAGTAFGSTAADDAHSPEDGFSGDRTASFQAAAAGGLIGEDLGSPRSIAAVHNLSTRGGLEGRQVASGGQHGRSLDRFGVHRSQPER